MTRYRVAGGTQVNVAGVLYGPGEVLTEVPDDLPALLVTGVVVEVVDPPKAPKAQKAG
ncbi:MAG: hypothetical protein ACR2GF_02800 [Acidimicrobiales bacterium]